MPVSVLQVPLVCVLLCALGWLGRAAGGLAPLPHFGPHLGPLTVVRHAAPPAVPPYSTQINVFRWLAAFPPPVLHRALLLAQGPPSLHHPPSLHPLSLHHPPPLHHPLHPPVVHHGPLTPAHPPPTAVVPTAPVLPAPPPPLVPAVVRSTPTPALPLPLGFPLQGGFHFPPEALPFPPSILPTSAFLPLPGRGLLPAAPAAFPTPAFPLPAASTPTLRTPVPFPFPVHGVSPHGLLPQPAFGPFGHGVPGALLPPLDLDLGPTTRTPAPPAFPAPTAPPASPSPSPAHLFLPDGRRPVQFSHFLPNGITRATAGSLAL